MLSLAAGALTVAAFAPLHLYPLAVLCPAVLLWLLHDRTPGRGALLGFCYGLGLMGAGVHWLAISIDLFGGVSWLLARFVTVLFVVALALYWALFSGLLCWLGPRLSAPLRWLVLAPLCWGGVEWLRGWLFTGFPWLQLGYAHTDSPLAAVAPILGVLGVGWVNMLLVGALVLGLRADWRRLGGSVFIGLLALTLLLEPVDWTHSTGESIELTLVQGNIGQERKWRPETIAETLQTYLQLSLESAPSDLVIWPETAVPAFASQVEASFLNPLERRLKSSGSQLLLGIPLREADGRYYNALLLLGDTRRAHYAKRHLVPFGEYLPLQGLIGPLVDWLRIPMSAFSPGEKGPPLMWLSGHPAALSICYEDVFGDETIAALPQAQFLVNASNDAWFGDSLAPHQHLQIARMRALETGRWMARVTNTGISALIDHQGRVVQRSEQFVAQALRGAIDLREGATPYARGGMLPLLILWGGLCVLLWLLPGGLGISRRVSNPQESSDD